MKNPKRPDRALLEDIVIAAKKIQRSLRGVTLEEFLTNDDKQAATCYSLGIVGEASGNFSAELRERNPHIKWAQIKSLRNIIIHAYHGVNMERIWVNSTIDVVQLLADLADECRRAGIDPTTY